MRFIIQNEWDYVIVYEILLIHGVHILEDLFKVFLI